MIPDRKAPEDGRHHHGDTPGTRRSPRRPPRAQNGSRGRVSLAAMTKLLTHDGTWPSRRIATGVAAEQDPARVVDHQHRPSGRRGRVPRTPCTPRPQGVARRGGHARARHRGHQGRTRCPSSCTTRDGVDGTTNGSGDLRQVADGAPAPRCRPGLVRRSARARALQPGPPARRRTASAGSPPGLRKPRTVLSSGRLPRAHAGQVLGLPGRPMNIEIKGFPRWGGRRVRRAERGGPRRLLETPSAATIVGLVQAASRVDRFHEPWAAVDRVAARTAARPPAVSTSHPEGRRLPGADHLQAQRRLSTSRRGERRPRGRCGTAWSEGSPRTSRKRRTLANLVDRSRAVRQGCTSRSVVLKGRSSGKRRPASCN